MKIGTLVKYKDKPCIILFVSGSGYTEIREYHPHVGRIGIFTGPIERVHSSELVHAE